MCRFVSYFGNEKILLDELLEKPENSLIQQSHKVRGGVHGINADGFGVAWYDFEVDDEPGIFKSTQPAWNDINLMHLSKKVRSSCFLAHVRASTVGDVNQNNCHPFAFKEYSLVHNGTIRHFESLKRSLLRELEDELFFHVKGNTDSECFFFLVMHFLDNGKITLIEAIRKAIEWIVEAQKDQDSEHFSKINIVITNGKEMIGTRFVSKGKQPLSLSYATSSKDGRLDSIILSSESLDNYASSWHEVPENSYVYFNKDKAELEIDRL